MDVWAKIELMGHVCIAGRLTEEEHYGAKMGRVDVPNGDGFTTQFFSGASVYRITLCTEQVARDMAKRSSDAAPVSPWDYPKAALPGPVMSRAENYGDDEDDDSEQDDDREGDENIRAENKF